MKVLVATYDGRHAGDADDSWTVEGELLAVASGEVCAAARCGCGRAFSGLASSRVTMTAMVADLAHVDAGELWLAVRDWLERDGWLDLLGDANEVIDLVDGYVEEIARVCAAFPTGTVLGREGTRVFDRQALPV